MPPPDIRLLGPGDRDILARVHPDVFDHPVLQSRAAAFLAAPDARLAVALDGGPDGGLVIGFDSGLLCGHPDKPAPDLWINEVGVAGPWRRRGIASAPMAALREAARAAGARSVWVLADPQAEPFYRALGGEEARVAMVSWPA